MMYLFSRDVFQQCVINHASEDPGCNVVTEFDAGD